LIEGKYKKLSVRDFIERIIGRVGKLPILPCTSIYKAIQQCEERDRKTDVRTQLQAVYEAIRSRSWPFTVDSRPWAEWLNLIHQHKIATDEILLALVENESRASPTTAFLVFRQTRVKDALSFISCNPSVGGTRGERERRGRFLASTASSHKNCRRPSHKTDRSRGCHTEGKPRQNAGEHGAE
jgi:hypothetical protein